jgi:hypothetical protein
MGVHPLVGRVMREGVVASEVDNKDDRILENINVDK